MFGRVSSFVRQPQSWLRRQFSVKAIYSSFPATLHYYCPRRSSTLFDHKENDSRPDDVFDQGVIVDKNGLVYPGVSPTHVSNGAVMFPNTFMMQELVRTYLDQVLDREDQGKPVDTPCIYTIPKGTPVSSHLILINDHISRFSLQPSRGMLLKDLNRYLDEFYSKHAHKEAAHEWLDVHPFQGAISDDADAVWMAE